MSNISKTQISDFYNFLNLIIKNDEDLYIYFEKYSDIYVEEFLMFFSIKAYLEPENNIKFIAPIEIHNILIDLIKNSYLFNKLERICVKYTQNYLIYNLLKPENIYLNIGQENLKKYIKDIFNHDMISKFITNIKLEINYYSKHISIETQNNIYVGELIDSIKIKFNIKNPIYLEKILEKNKTKLNTTKILDYYNINSDMELYCYNIQKG